MDNTLKQLANSGTRQDHNVGLRRYRYAFLTPRKLPEILTFSGLTKKLVYFYVSLYPCLPPVLRRGDTQQSATYTQPTKKEKSVTH